MPDHLPVAADDPELLTLQETADALKVHYMTAYRWVRRGELSAFKAGGRLRVRSRDLEAFVADRIVDTAEPARGARRTDWPLHVARLHEHLLAGAGADAMALARKVVTDGAPVGDVYIRLLAPAMHILGEDWAAGRISVSVEHRATEIAASIVVRLGAHFRRRGPARGTAITLTPPGDLHALGAGMVASFLRAAGYEVHHLGPSVPAVDLRGFLDQVHPDVVCISVTRSDIQEQVLADLAEAAAAHGDVLTVVGGQGSDAEVARRIGAVHLADLADLTGRIAGHSS